LALAKSHQAEVVLALNAANRQLSTKRSPLIQPFGHPALVQADGNVSAYCPERQARAKEMAMSKSSGDKTSETPDRFRHRGE
jgi:hypothetical protein